MKNWFAQNILNPTAGVTDLVLFFAVTWTLLYFVKQATPNPFKNQVSIFQNTLTWCNLQPNNFLKLRTLE